MKIKDFLNFDINLPSLEVQDKIIAIIDKIEKKIRTNSQINENLPSHLCVAHIAATQLRQSLQTDGCLHTDSNVAGRSDNLETPQVFSA